MFERQRLGSRAQRPAYRLRLDVAVDTNDVRFSTQHPTCTKA